MSSNIAIHVKEISKCYHMYDKPSDRLKQIVFGKKKKYYKEFWALRDISFQVAQGTTVGIIGRNGSGKSTLLQIIAGTLSPTSGDVWVKGRVAALLELGSGFNPDFTGRENIYLYGSIYGIKKEEMDGKLDEILSFADIGEFIDQPVKNYSSGMFVRLAFSVAVNIDAEILIVDEALSVGDMFFQAKCFDKLNELKKKGVTLLFVSHSMETVKALCDKCILIQEGELLFEGDSMRSADMYSKVSLANSNYDTVATRPKLDEMDIQSTMQPPFEKRVTQRFGDGVAKYIDAYIVDEEGNEIDTVRHGEPCKVVAYIHFEEECDMESEFGIVVRNQEGIEIYALNSFFKGISLPPQKKGTTVRIEFDHVMALSPGTYNIAFGLRIPVQGSYSDKVYNGIVFRVVLNYGQTFIPGLVSIPGTISYKEMSLHR
ncbi:ABC transporter ATP-binding protein [Brevibacillus sp. HB1.2]|uniref:ABC transporter ATP-binding protein n=1 Tax=unclassified Brevibacillus TaxID=2684853 RepID=UPI001576C5C2|nr:MULTISPECIES: ABC transporter ATP-binding protein [unclassified Brevibacillus]NTU21750.1 ABC transporter ATP-binding protein [Brevibacillus sp. HB1.2]NTU31099.1 ABC transporter ATP-binding protein [Brevibacillus sp. HB1.1]